MVAEGAQKGYKVDDGAAGVIAGIAEAVRNPGVEAPVAAREQAGAIKQYPVGVQRVPASERPDLQGGVPSGQVIDGLVAEQAAEAAVEQAEVPVIDFDPELPESIQELLADDPDDDEDDDTSRYAAPASESPYELGDEPVGYEDEVAKLRRELAKAQKKAEWADEQARKAKRDKWEAEARKFFPLSSPESIQADSRRSFIKAAEAQHNAVKNNPVIMQYREQAIAAANAEAAKIKEQARLEAQQAWGKPVAGPGLVPAQQGSYEDEIAKARRKGDLTSLVGYITGNIPTRR